MLLFFGGGSGEKAFQDRWQEGAASVCRQENRHVVRILALVPDLNSIPGQLQDVQICATF